MKNQNEPEQVEEKISTAPLYTDENYPKVDGSTATAPLAEAFEANFKGKKIDEVNVEHSKTHKAYEKLINKELDLILVTSPSEDEEKLAKKANVELEVTKVVNEGFVFFLNKNNPVDSLTVEQIQKIYSGEITNWKEVGGNDEEIIAYQRPNNSGSQTGMLDLVMKDKKIKEAPKEKEEQPKVEHLSEEMIREQRARIFAQKYSKDNIDYTPKDEVGKSSEEKKKED